MFTYQNADVYNHGQQSTTCSCHRRYIIVKYHIVWTVVYWVHTIDNYFTQQVQWYTYGYVRRKPRLKLFKAQCNVFIN